MKIAVIGANGKAGRAIVEEALRRNMDVCAVVRGENKSGAAKCIQKDLFALTKEDLKEFDVIINAFGAWTEETLPQHRSSLVHIADLLRGSDTRLLVVGGAGSLYVDAEKSVQLMNTEGFPEAYKPLAAAMSEGLSYLRSCHDVKWTYISPAADFQAEGARTGSYVLAGEVFTVNAKGESFISYADYAIAMIDEAAKGSHIQQRISVLTA